MYEVSLMPGEETMPAYTMEEAMETAQNFAFVSGCNIYVLQEGEEVAALIWHNRPAESEDEVTVNFGPRGFYGEWATL